MILLNKLVKVRKQYVRGFMTIFEACEVVKRIMLMASEQEINELLEIVSEAKKNIEAQVWTE